MHNGFWSRNSSQQTSCGKPACNLLQWCVCPVRRNVCVRYLSGLRPPSSCCLQKYLGCVIVGAFSKEAEEEAIGPEFPQKQQASDEQGVSTVCSRCGRKLRYFQFWEAGILPTVKVSDHCEQLLWEFASILSLGQACSYLHWKKGKLTKQKKTSSHMFKSWNITNELLVFFPEWAGF